MDQLDALRAFGGNDRRDSRARVHLVALRDRIALAKTRAFMGGFVQSVGEGHNLPR
jgi:hypothetical protein